MTPKPKHKKPSEDEIDRKIDGLLVMLVRDRPKRAKAILIDMGEIDENNDCEPSELPLES